MATFTEHLNIDERTPKHNVGDKVSFTDVGKDTIYTGSVYSHEWSVTSVGGENRWEYESRYDVCSDEGNMYYITDKEFIE